MVLATCTLPVSSGQCPDKIKPLAPNLDISNAGDSGHVEAFDVSWNTQKGVLASSITLRN